MKENIGFDEKRRRQRSGEAQHKDMLNHNFIGKLEEGKQTSRNFPAKQTVKRN